MSKQGGCATLFNLTSLTRGSIMLCACLFPVGTRKLKSISLRWLCSLRSLLRDLVAHFFDSVYELTGLKQLWRMTGLVVVHRDGKDVWALMWRSLLLTVTVTLLRILNGLWVNIPAVLRIHYDSQGIWFVHLNPDFVQAAYNWHNWLSPLQQNCFCIFARDAKRQIKLVKAFRAASYGILFGREF